MPPFAFRFAFFRRAIAPGPPAPDPEVFSRYLVQRHLAGDTVREIAAELELSELEVQRALLQALRLL